MIRKKTTTSLRRMKETVGAAMTVTMVAETSSSGRPVAARRMPTTSIAATSHTDHGRATYYSTTSRQRPYSRDGRGTIELQFDETLL